jgi:hypothetical protein
MPNGPSYRAHPRLYRRFCVIGLPGAGRGYSTRWLVAVSEHTWQALGIVGSGRVWGTSPVCHGPANWTQRPRLANSSASGHAAAKAMRTRLAVSVMRAAILSSRARKVVNSALAKG